MAAQADQLIQRMLDLEPGEDTFGSRDLLDSLYDDGEALPADWAGLVVLDAIDTLIDSASASSSASGNSDAVSGSATLDLLVSIDLLDKLEAKTAAAKAALLAAYNEQRVFRPGFRTAATARSHRRSLSGRHTGAEVSFAMSLAELPSVFTALSRASITVEHAKRIVALHREPHLREAVKDDQDWLVNWASTLTWAEFAHIVDNWAELADKRDPADLDPGADKRGMAWAHGVGGTTLVELVMPHLMFEQFQQILRVEFDRLLDQEWAEARAAREATGGNPDDVTTADLPRSDKMRWHDALMIVIRRGGIDPDLVDPGCSFSVAVTVDLMTLMHAAQAASSKNYLRFSAPSPSSTQATTEDPPMPDTERDRLGSVESYRCETASGVRISPQLALWCALATHIRRVTLDANDRSTSLSSPARLFNQSQRAAMLVRDRHCRGPGCGRRSGRLEADHIQPASREGPTHTANGQMLCSPCHRHKTWLQAMGLLDAVEHLWNPNHHQHPDAPTAQPAGQPNDPRLN